MQYYASTEMYGNKCIESHVCNNCTYRQYSVSGVLSEDAMLSINLCFKTLNTLQNIMSRTFRIMLFIMSLHVKKLA